VKRQHLRLEVRRHESDTRCRKLHWKRSLPFLVNPRARLIHRPRAIATHLSSSGSYRHNSASFFCGNQANGDLVVSAEPPEGMLVCAKCEAAATSAGLPSSAELLGRHVCIGVVRAKNICHPEQGE